MVREAIRTCDQCQRKKTRKIDKAPQELHPIDVPFGKQWHQVGVDLMSFQESGGYRYLMTAVCYFTKWAEMAALKTKSAAEVAYHLWIWMLRHGAPKILITDQGREFNNELNTELCQFTGTEHRITSAYHPQTNGLTERMNRSTTDALRASLQEDLTKWVELIPCIQAMHNDRKQASTKFSPFELMYGKPRHLPIEERRSKEELLRDDLTEEEFRELEALGSEQAVVEHVKQMKQIQDRIFSKASHNIKQAQLKMKKRYDKKYIGKPPLEEGTMVLKQAPKNETRKGGKLESKWKGPFRVGEFNKRNGTYQLITLTGKALTRFVPASQVKVYHDAMGQFAEFKEGSQEEISGVHDSDVETVKCGASATPTFSVPSQQGKVCTPQCKMHVRLHCRKKAYVRLHGTKRTYVRLHGLERLSAPHQCQSVQRKTCLCQVSHLLTNYLTLGRLWKSLRMMLQLMRRMT